MGVHIADVSHFVRGATALDDEALRRGTSCYLINRVIPMLPEELSNGRCSLVPHEDRFTLSVFIDLDRQLRVREVRPAETLIHSKHRLTYEEALAIIEGDDAVEERFGPELVENLHACHNLLRGFDLAVRKMARLICTQLNVVSCLMPRVSQSTCKLSAVMSPTN